MTLADTAPTVQTKTFMSRAELAEYLTARGVGEITVKTLDKWKHRGYGPACARFGRSVRYSISDVEAWIEATASAA